jgi:hypothetical protein
MPLQKPGCFVCKSENDGVQPARQGSARIEPVGYARERRESCLESIFGRVRIRCVPNGHRPNERPMPANKRFECTLIPRGDKGIKELRVGGLF